MRSRVVCAVVIVRLLHLKTATRLREASLRTTTERRRRPAHGPDVITDTESVGRTGAGGSSGIDAEVSPDGRLHIAYVDGCPPGCVTATQSTANDGWVASQETGHASPAERSGRLGPGRRMWRSCI
jgi:hypothetical protein